MAASGRQQGAGTKKKYAFIDVDIDDWRAGYQRAVDFVKANNLKYSLSTDELEQASPHFPPPILPHLST